MGTGPLLARQPVCRVTLPPRGPATVENTLQRGVSRTERPSLGHTGEPLPYILAMRRGKDPFDTGTTAVRDLWLYMAWQNVSNGLTGG